MTRTRITKLIGWVRSPIGAGSNSHRVRRNWPCYALMGRFPLLPCFNDGYTPSENDPDGFARKRANAVSYMADTLISP
jgi:hypothetical protein